jgi:hypothetical protein
MFAMSARLSEMSLMSEMTAMPAIPARFPLTLISAMSAAARVLLLWVRILPMKALSIVVLQEWWKWLM